MGGVELCVPGVSFRVSLPGPVPVMDFWSNGVGRYFHFYAPPSRALPNYRIGHKYGTMWDYYWCSYG